MLCAGSLKPRNPNNWKTAKTAQKRIGKNLEKKEIIV